MPPQPRGATTRASWRALHDAGRDGEWQLAIPITAPEVWGCGVTYRRSADFREEGLGIYDRIYEADRPELFYKASPSRSVGPHAPIGRRRDSQFTAAEPEVALVVSSGGDILGFTIANDVSAWDIERDNPLYLPQSKIYAGCFSFGPAVVTPDEIADPLRARADLPGGARRARRSSAAPRPRPAQAEISRARALAAPIEHRADRNGALDGHRHHPADRDRPRAGRHRQICRAPSSAP